MMLKWKLSYLKFFFLYLFFLPTEKKKKKKKEKRFAFEIKRRGKEVEYLFCENDQFYSKIKKKKNFFKFIYIKNII